MSNSAPHPPTKRLLLATGVSIGLTTGIWAITAVGHLVFSGIPANRLPWYVGAGLAGVILSGYLGTRYALQKHRRDAWWDGYAASDEPGGEVIELRDFRRNDGDTRGLGTGSPS